MHEAYLRLVDLQKVQHWNSRGHFFAAAAEAMRRILVERARRKKSRKHGGDWQRVDLDSADVVCLLQPDELLSLHDALDRFAETDAAAAELVKVRCFAGLSVEEAGDALGLSRTTAYRHWTFARALAVQSAAGRFRRPGIVRIRHFSWDKSGRPVALLPG